MIRFVDVIHWWGGRVWRRLPGRRSTVMMAVAFIGLGSLYLQVLSEARETPVLSIFEDPTTTLPSFEPGTLGASPGSGVAVLIPPVDTDHMRSSAGVRERRGGE